MTTPLKGRGVISRAPLAHSLEQEEGSFRTKRPTGPSWKSLAVKGVLTPGPSHFISLAGGAVTAWLYVFLLGQLCLGKSPGKVLPGEQIEDAVWAEGEGSLLLGRDGGATIDMPEGTRDDKERGLQRVLDQGRPWRRPLTADPYPETRLENVVFGIASSAELWEERQKFVRLWWREGLRGSVWMGGPASEEEWRDQVYVKLKLERDPSLPEVRFSEDTSHFSYTHPAGNRAAIRIARIVGEAVRANGDDPSIHWYVLGDDDTIFSPDNLADVLSKYDHRRMYYIGAPSETHHQNAIHSWSMAFGGAGFAISVTLAKALARVQDECMDRYPELYGSDGRVQACITELGIQVTRERGFHQLDLVGNLAGVLEAHPVAPFLSYHHVGTLQALLPNKTSIEALGFLATSMQSHPREFLQQTMCVDKERDWTMSIAWGYSIRWYPEVLRPLELERALMTFQSWDRLRDPREFSIDTRPLATSKGGLTASVFEIEHVGKRVVGDKTYLETVYSCNKEVPEEGTLTGSKRFKKGKRKGTLVESAEADEGSDDAQPRKKGRKPRAWFNREKAASALRKVSPRDINVVRVLMQPLGREWVWHPRRQCCKSLNVDLETSTAEVILGPCN